MLADKMSDKFNWNSGPWMVEYKYDGMRILAKVDTNGVTYYSRNGMEQENFEGLFDEDLYDIAQQFVNKRAVEDGGSFPIWFDGEVMASTYQKTMEANSSKGEKKELIFVTFDMLTHIEWASQTTKRNQKERRVDLEKAYDSSIETPKKVFTSNLIITDKPEEVQKFYDGLVEQGAEGVIIKDMKAPYHWKRNRAWTKYKPRYTADLEIVGFFEGKGKYEDSLGGFRLKGELEDGTLVECECGSGFNDSQRNDYWLNRDVLLNEIAEVMYQEVTANKKGDTASLRFPIFKHFRKDK
jgi:DNA ligase-1